MPSPSRDEFFVGYLPTPPGLGKLLRRTAMMLLPVALISAGVIASRQRDPGDGNWQSDVTRHAGVLITKPYPMLQPDDGSAPILLVGEGKFAAEIPKDAHEGQRARVHGTIIERGALRMLEVEHSIELQSSDGTIKAASVDAQPRQLQGEIVDSKCFAGAMKPGEGKTHKGCAALCLRGGMPPAFVTNDGQILLLVNAAGQRIAGDDLERVIALVGEPIRIAGVVEVRAGVQLLKIDPLELHR